MNRLKTMHRSKLFLLAASVALGGCSSEEAPSGLPSLVPVTINVQQGGVPLEGASVQLVMVDSSNPWASGGSSDASGNVKVMTLGKYEGAAEGKYKVIVAKTVTDSAAAAASNDPAASTEHKIYDYVDLQYKLAEKTPLEIEVSASDAGTPKVIDVGPPIKKEAPKI